MNADISYLESPSEQTRKAYSDFLQSKEWDYWFTVTFRAPRRDSIYNSQQIWNVLHSQYNTKRSFLVSEPHTTGFLHYHGLAKRGYSTLDLQCDLIQRGLTKVFGWSNVEPIRGMAEVAGYCTKYILKSVIDPHTNYFFMGKPIDWHDII